ncbi:MAG: transglutaminase domain-containing protein [Planctomycetota bacterium]
MYRRQFHRASLVAATLAGLPRAGYCEADTDADQVLTYDKPSTTSWRMGFRLNTTVPFTRGTATFPVPMDWPEQSVEVTEREVSVSGSSVTLRKLDGGARQVVVTMPRVLAGTEMEVWFEMDIDKRRIVGPADPSSLVIAKQTQLPREIRRYLGSSPHIDTTHIQIRMLSKELAADAPENAWDRVRQIYDTVRHRVQYLEGPIRNASDALRTGHGDCEDMTSLFVALCRNAQIPARMVWVPGHCYPEFYLQPSGSHSTRDNGIWFPCQVAGSEQFGSMEETRPILQKGDRFKVPESRSAVRYVAEFFTCLRSGTAAPRIEFFREPLTPAS